MEDVFPISRNPLKSGQCFLLVNTAISHGYSFMALSQSPQIGSMFLTYKWDRTWQYRVNIVAIPSNRVNVSYSIELDPERVKRIRSQSPQIGSMFLTKI